MAAWEGSTRRQRLPRNWPQIRRRILARDPTCKLCSRNPSTEVDHITRGDDHSDANLRGLCHACHRRKSSSEGGQAKRSKHSSARPAERHPGLLG